MILPSRFRWMQWVVALVTVSLLWTGPLGPLTARVNAVEPPVFFDDDDDDAKKKGSKKKKKGSKKGSKKKRSSKKKRQRKKKVIRWGQRRNESDAKYDKRYKRVMAKVKQDKRGDFSGGHFENAKGEKIRLWTYMGYPFVVRTDIDREFTADTVMYMEMLHREYGKAYKMLVGIPPNLNEAIEVIVFADRATYVKNGGSANSGGYFDPVAHARGDRGPFWKAKHKRLVQFTSGITKFAKWPKGTLKHEAAHMELQLRLGYTLPYGIRFGWPVDCPRWWNEGHATVFEYWDFDKSVEENFAEIPNRGRYAPVIRRIHDTGKWKDFHYIWTIDPKSWHEDMSSQQGFLNYTQAWSLCAYMMNEGVKGRRDFRTIFNLSKRVGVDYQKDYQGTRTFAWTDKFPEDVQAKLDKNWNAWVAKNVSRDKKVPDEAWLLKRQGYKPEVVDRLEGYTEEEKAELMEWIEREKERRRKARTIEW